MGYFGPLKLGYLLTSENEEFFNLKELLNHETKESLIPFKINNYESIQKLQNNPNDYGYLIHILYFLIKDNNIFKTFLKDFSTIIKNNNLSNIKIYLDLIENLNICHDNFIKIYSNYIIIENLYIKQNKHVSAHNINRYNKLFYFIKNAENLLKIYYNDINEKRQYIFQNNKKFEYDFNNIINILNGFYNNNIINLSKIKSNNIILKNVSYHTYPLLNILIGTIYNLYDYFIKNHMIFINVYIYVNDNYESCENVLIKIINKLSYIYDNFNLFEKKIYNENDLSFISSTIYNIHNELINDTNNCFKIFLAIHETFLKRYYSNLYTNELEYEINKIIKIFETLINL